MCIRTSAMLHENLPRLIGVIWQKQNRVVEGKVFLALAMIHEEVFRFVDRFRKRLILALLRVSL